MRALQYTKFNGTISLNEVPDPQLVPNSAIVKIESASICKSDISAWKGVDPHVSVPIIPGHEFYGHVAQKSDEVEIQNGTPVVVPVTCGCGMCGPCKNGQQHICQNPFQPGFTHNGGFAEYVLIPNANQNLVPLPGHLQKHSSALLSCRVACAYHAIMKSHHHDTKSWCLIFGFGVFGMSCLKVAKALGFKTIVIELAHEKLAKAKAMKANHTFHFHTPSLVNLIGEIVKDSLFLSIETSGNLLAIEKSIKTLCETGHHLQLGFISPYNDKAISPQLISTIISKEISFIGSHGVNGADYSSLFSLIHDAEINLDSLVEVQVPMELIPNYFSDFDTNHICGAVMMV